MPPASACHTMCAISQIWDQETVTSFKKFAYRLVAVRTGLNTLIKVKEKHLEGILKDELKGYRLNREK